MEQLPADILAIIPEDARPAVDRWWSGLPDADRHATAGLWDERRESHFFTPQDQDSDDWDRLPEVIGGRFVPHDDSVRIKDWLEDWYEYVIEHEEIVFLSRVGLLFRTFHICQVEAAARAVQKAGLLPAEFKCPVANDGCPMRRVQAMSPGNAMHLTPSAAGGWWVVAPWQPLRTRGEPLRSLALAMEFPVSESLPQENDKSLALPSLVCGLCSGPVGIAMATIAVGNQLPEPTKQMLVLLALVLPIGGAFLFACGVRFAIQDHAPSRLRRFANAAIAAPIAWSVCILAVLLYFVSQLGT